MELKLCTSLSGSSTELTGKFDSEEKSPRWSHRGDPVQALPGFRSILSLAFKFDHYCSQEVGVRDDGDSG